MPHELLHEDITKIRDSVGRIDREGCGQAGVHSRGIESLWLANEKLNRKVDGMLTKIVVSVLLIVLCGAFGNWFFTNRALSSVAPMDYSAVIENQKLIKELKHDIKELHDTLGEHRKRSTYDPAK